MELPLGQRASGRTNDCRCVVREANCVRTGAHICDGVTISHQYLSQAGNQHPGGIADVGHPGSAATNRLIPMGGHSDSAKPREKVPKFFRQPGIAVWIRFPSCWATTPYLGYLFTQRVYSPRAALLRTCASWGCASARRRSSQIFLKNETVVSECAFCGVFECDGR